MNPSDYYYTLNQIFYRNIHIPLKYRLDTKIFYCAIGFYGEYLFKIQADDIDKYNELYITDRKYEIGYSASFGLEKSISSQFSVFVEGSFTANLTSLGKEDSFFYFNAKNNYQHTNYGLSIGINYKILKK